MIEAKQLSAEELAKIEANQEDYASRNTIGDLLGHIAWLEQQKAMLSQALGVSASRAAELEEQLYEIVLAKRGKGAESA